MYRQTFRRAVRHYGVHPIRAMGFVNDSPVFIVGCPRSGTTFTASALGAVTGFIDLGEVPRFKRALPGLFQGVATGARAESVRQIRSIITFNQRIAMAGGRTAIEQTPESTFLIPEIADAFPKARFVHLIRDGRDVATSLLERGWLAADPALAEARDGRPVDDAGHPFGNYARFWVEPERKDEFESATDATRCGWAWRRYLSSALSALNALEPGRSIAVRYEDLVSQPAAVGERLASALGAHGKREQFARALSTTHSRSVGQWRTKLGTQQLNDVLSQESTLLRSLGYLS